MTCSVLIDGFAFRQKLTGDGRRQIIAVCIPGDAVDLQNMFLNVSDHSVQMLTRGTVADLKRSDLQDLALSRPAIGAAIIKTTLVEASIFREWVVNVGRRDARERIAHVLCEFAVRLEARGLASGGFELPMTSGAAGRHHRADPGSRQPGAQGTGGRWPDHPPASPDPVSRLARAPAGRRLQPALSPPSRRRYRGARRAGGSG